jgi:hypothetical protein
VGLQQQQQQERAYSKLESASVSPPPILLQTQQQLQYHKKRADGAEKQVKQLKKASADALDVAKRLKGSREAAAQV